MESVVVTNMVFKEVHRASAFGVSPFFLLLLIGLFILLLVGGIVLIAVRRRPPIPAPMPAAPVPVSSESRQAILRKLADGELTKAEAEEQLNQLGTPVPVAMPAPPPRSGAGKGCLIALIIAVLIIPLVFLALFFLTYFVGMHPVTLLEPTCIEQPAEAQSANPDPGVETAYLSVAREAVGGAGATFHSLHSRKRPLHLAIGISSPKVFTNSAGGKS